MSKTVIDFSAAYPPASAITQAGHSGVVLYLAPAREAWMNAKRITRGVVDGYRAAGLDIAVVWQYRKGGSLASGDTGRGRAGGLADAKAAEAKLQEVGLPGHPVFFAVDWNCTLDEWNGTARRYFAAAVEVLGRDRVGIYGHSRVLAWAQEDGVVADVGGGRVLGWQTTAWSKGVISPRAVLLQNVHNVAGPGGVLIDINRVENEYWGQRAPGGAPPPKPEGGSSVKDPVMERYLNIEAHENRIMQKHRTVPATPRTIRYITRHHVAGFGDAASGWRTWQTRAASAHYWVNPDGTIAQLVWDSHIAWSNGNSASNAVSLSIEHPNRTGAPGWDISDTVIDNGARWAAALCLHYKLGRPQFGKNIRDHREFYSTSCPFHLANGGKYHRRWMEEAQSFYDKLVAYQRGENNNNDSEEELTMSQYQELKAQQDRIERKVDLVLDQLAGPQRNAENGLPEFTGWEALGNRTVVDFLATLGAKFDVPKCVAVDDCEHGSEADGSAPCDPAENKEGE